MDSGYCPPGAAYDSNAPYNEEPLKEYEVLVSLILSKTVKVTAHNEEGIYDAVEKQIVLPHELANCVDWYIDDITIIKE